MGADLVFRTGALVTRNGTTKDGRREVDVRLFEWGEIGETEQGPELIEAGAIDGVDPRKVMARLDHENPLIGRAMRLWSEKDGPYATLQMSKSARAADAMQLVDDGLYQGVSVGFVWQPPDEYRNIDGRSVAVRKSIDLREVSLTWLPAYEGGQVIAVRSEKMTQPNTGAEAQAPAVPAVPAMSPAIRSMSMLPATGAIQTSQAQPPTEGALAQLLERMDSRLAQLEDERRKDVDVPGAPKGASAKALMGRWAKAALTFLDGEKVPDLELRALADVTTADNLGVVPKNIRSEVLGLIDPARPFLNSTRQVDAGDSGMTQTFPKITQRPATAVQAAEKDEVASQKTIIGSVDFGVVTIAGAGDLSIQLLKRSSPAFLQLWMELLAEQYAIDADNGAVDALLGAGVTAGAAPFDPESPGFGEAFTNAMTASRLLMPDRIWLSTSAVAAFMDAKTAAGGAGVPLYPGLVKISGVTREGNGSGPVPIELTPVHVPALDDEAVDLIIGPSRGFAWAEDGTYQLSADVPAKAGRDVGLVGMIWYMPVYPAAFTTYALPA